MKQLRITTAIATYNSASVLREVIESVLGQDYNNVELLIIDGGSKDSTVSLIMDYADKYTNVKWISEPDKGIYDAMNKALKMATGDFLIFLGSDDHFISNNVLTEVVSRIDDVNSVYYGDVYRNSRNDLYKGKFNSLKIACENICHQAIFYPQSIYKNNIYDIKFPIYADYIYNIRLWNKTKFIYIPICISYYNCSGISGSGNDDEKYSKQFFHEVHKNLGLFYYVMRYFYKILKR